MNLKTSANKRITAPTCLISALVMLVVSACAPALVKMHDQNQSVVTIKTGRQELGIRAVDNRETAFFTGGFCGSYAKAVEVAPGKHDLDICYVTRNGTKAENRLSIDATEGKNYTIKATLTSYDVLFWIEEDSQGAHASGNTQ